MNTTSTVSARRTVLIVLTSHDKKGSTGQKTGAYFPEFVHPHRVFVDAGLDVAFASTRGGKAPLDGVDRGDPLQAAFLDDPRLVRQIEETRAPRDLRASDYAAIFFSGGHGTMWDFPDQPELARLAADIYEAGGVVGAVCHGPAGLLNVTLSNGQHLVAGKEVAAFTNDEERAVKLEEVVPFLLADELVKRGAKHVPAGNWKANVIVSERLVTGQNPASAKGVAEKMVEVLAPGASAERPSSPARR
ncbi:MAG: type 1 glutamine amidotransferase domain-containing protein [Polyangiaceae bacterium]